MCFSLRYLCTKRNIKKIITIKAQPDLVANVKQTDKYIILLQDNTIC